MALFAGSGSFVLSGEYQKVLDCEFTNSAKIVLDGPFSVEIAGCTFKGNVGISNLGESAEVNIHHNHFYSTTAVDGSGDNDQWLLHDNLVFCQSGFVGLYAEQVTIQGNTFVITGGNRGYAVELVASEGYEVIVSDNVVDGAGIYVEGVGGGGQFGLSVHGNVVLEPTMMHGIELVDCTRGMVHHNSVTSLFPTDSDTYDGINVSGGTGVRVDHNTVIAADGFLGGTARSGINIVSGTGHVVVGNDLGAAADYQSGPLLDGGSGTVLSYPGDMTYGDNFVA